VDVGDACFYECLCLLGMLAFADGVAFHSKANDFIDQALSYLVEVDKKATSISKDVKRLVEIFSMVNFLYYFDNHFRDAVNFLLFTHKVDLVVQRFGHLEYGVDKESITELIWLGAVEAKHLLTQLLLHVLREVVKKSQKVFETDEF